MELIMRFWDAIASTVAPVLYRRLHGEGELMTYSASTIARWFVEWARHVQEDDYDLTPLKLQKLLYYAQGHWIASEGRPLFEERIKAWGHGPVVPQVWHDFKDAGSGVIPAVEDFSWGDVDPAVTDFLIGIWNTYGLYSASTLRNMTHREEPWMSAFAKPGDSPEISRESMAMYFSRLTASSGHR